MLSALTGVCCAADPEHLLEACACAVCMMGLAGELSGAETAARGGGTASFRVGLIDWVSKMNEEIPVSYTHLLAKRALPLNQDGMVYTNENIDALLLFRHTARKIRNAGGRLKGNAKRDRAVQDKAFADALRKILLGA